MTQLSGYPSPPSSLVEAGNENRPISILRAAAQTKDPLKILFQAAVAYFAVGHAAALLPYLFGSGADPVKAIALWAMEHPELAPALADLSVTGRATYDKLVSIGPRESLLLDQVLGPMNGWPEATHDNVLYAIREALDRAYQVARAVRGHEARDPLRWIAVAGEDDSPDRPVNVPSAPYPQYDLTVTVKGIPVVTRYMIASEANRITSPPPIILPPPPLGSPPLDLPRTLPATPLPLLPWPDNIILFIHGHSSRLEESLDLVSALQKVGREHGVPHTIIAMDLPCCGYSSMFDHTQVARPEASDYDFPNKIAHVPILDFIEEFIVQFVNTLEEQLTLQIQHIQDRIVAVIGGSLGGNMGLRLGRRSEPWLQKIIAWSPASVWNSLANATLDPIKAAILKVPYERINEDEQIELRHDYFAQVFDGYKGEPAQAPYWYRDGWPCKQTYIEMARHDRQEIYNASFRRWHWRVAYEQLIFSHLDPDTPGGPPRYKSIHSNMLLAAGSADNDPFLGLYAPTQDIAQKMSNTSGRTLFLLETGHSIHNERPQVLALAIEKFLEDGSLWHTTQATPSSGFGEWQIVGSASSLGYIAVGSNADGRLEVFALDAAGRPWHTVQPTPSSAFGPWSMLGSAAGLGQITVISTASGGLEVFAVDTDAGLAWTSFQNGPNGSFEGWVNMSGIAGLRQIAAGKNADGRLEVFTILQEP